MSTSHLCANGTALVTDRELRHVQCVGVSIHIKRCPWFGADLCQHHQHQEVHQRLCLWSMGRYLSDYGRIARSGTLAIYSQHLHIRYLVGYMLTKKKRRLIGQICVVHVCMRNDIDTFTCILPMFCAFVRNVLGFR